MAIYLALGANQPANYQGQMLEPSQTFCAALIRLQNMGVDIGRVSHIWQSPAWPDADAQPAYVNAVAQMATDLPPMHLLALLKKTEAAFGRTPGPRNGPRALDLDILDYHGQILRRKNLILPHPRMLARAFVLMPLAEIAPDWRDPKHKRPLWDWAARLRLADVAPLVRLGPLF